MSYENSSDEVAEDYLQALRGLEMNSRYEISNLTVIAKENTEHAFAISEAVKTHIKQVGRMFLSHTRTSSNQLSLSLLNLFANFLVFHLHFARPRHTRNCLRFMSSIQWSRMLEHHIHCSSAANSIRLSWKHMPWWTSIPAGKWMRC